MNRNIHILWLAFLCLIFPLSSKGFPVDNQIKEGTYKIPDAYKRVIQPLLSQDHESLQNNVRRDYMGQVSKDYFTELFYEGIERANQLFYREYFTKYAQKKYTKGVKKIIHSYASTSEYHSIEKHLIDKNIQGSLGVWPADSIFDVFSGEWYGTWKSEEVDHFWLRTQKLPNLSVFEEMEFSIVAFQSVYTGDGIGWNYLMEKEGMRYMLGFVVHFNEAGNIYLKRPHIGIPQLNGSIIWKTKDHMYVEFVCNKHSCDIKPEHYVITGISFISRKKNLKLIESFQAIYTRDSMMRPDWLSLYKK